MANEKNKPADLVEVRYLGKRPFKQETATGLVERASGEVFKIERSIYEASIEPDRGFGRPAHSKAFALVSDEKAQETAKKDERKAVEDRIAKMRESVQGQEAAREAGIASARHQQAEQARALAEATRPLERPGAVRVA